MYTKEREMRQVSKIEGIETYKTHILNHEIEQIQSWTCSTVNKFFVTLFLNIFNLHIREGNGLEQMRSLKRCKCVKESAYEQNILCTKIWTFLC